ncbi:MAG: sulfite oxidase, partial [Thermoplasmata archaeon]
LRPTPGSCRGAGSARAMDPTRRLARGSLPPPRRRLPSAGPNIVVSDSPACEEAPLGELDAAVPPTDRHFTRSHLPVPSIARKDWRLSVEGRVRRSFLLTYRGLLRLPHRSRVVTMECAGNGRSRIVPAVGGVRWRDGAVGTARWTGVPLRALLDRAGLLPEAREIVLEGADRGREEGFDGEIGFAMSLPVSKARDPDTILAFAMNDEPLRPSHGFPVRVIVPGWYGMASVKWLVRIRAIPGPFDGYYRTKSYVLIEKGDPPDRPPPPVTVLRVKSLITSPGSGARLSPGGHRVRGIAWSGEASIRRVELSATPEGGGPGTLRREAALSRPSGAHAWIRWEASVHLAAPGRYRLSARATDRAGNVQPLRTTWNLRGVATNSVHRIDVSVIAPERPARGSRRGPVRGRSP